MSTPGAPGAGWLAGGAGIVRESMLTIGDRIVEAVETRLVPPGAPPVGDALLDGVPVLSRREAWIVPLSSSRNSIPSATTGARLTGASRCADSPARSRRGQQPQ